MTLEEIFKDEPELLQNASVQKLIAYVKEQHARTYNINKKLKQFESDVMDVVMHSELILIEGTPAKEALKKIAKLYEAY
jgi:hypothetical protein